MNQISQTQQISDFEEVQKSKPGFITKFQPKLTKKEKAYQHAALVRRMSSYFHAKGVVITPVTTPATAA